MAVPARITSMIESGQWREAKAALLREVALRKQETAPEVLGLLVKSLVSLGEFAQGEFYARRLVALLPDSFEAVHSLGNVLQELGKFAESREALDRALALLDAQRNEYTGEEWRSRRAMTFFALGTCARGEERLVEAAGLLRQALLIDDTKPSVYIALANLLLRIGEVEDALDLVSKRVSVGDAVREDAVGGDTAKHRGTLAGAMASMIHYDPRVTQEEIIRIQNDFGDLYTNVTAPKVVKKRARDAKPGVEGPGDKGPLRIGVFSPDLHHHAVMKFFMPLVEHAKGVEWYFYHLGNAKDATTKWLEARSKGFSYLFGRSSSEVAAEALADDLDVALDLAGHTRGNRLGAFSVPIAKVQGTYLGYPGSTGLKTMDVRFSDTHTEPLFVDGLLREKIVRLDPSAHCFCEPANAPEVGIGPAQRDGVFTFGCFGAIIKHNKFMDGLLADVMKECPHAKLIIKHTGTRDEKLREKLRARLVEAGVDEKRLAVIGPTAGELDGFALVDVLLDTFPYHGTTTTCESLYMGVPVITLRGKTTPSRVGVSLLHAAGEPQFVAESPEGYIALARDISSGEAGARARLAELRASLRSRIKNSALMDGPSFANRFIERCRVLVEERVGLRKGQ